MKNYNKYIGLFLLLFGMSGNVWGMTTSDIENSAATTITDGAAYVIATAYNDKYLTSDSYNDWAPTTTDINAAAIFTAHGSASGFYLTCTSGTMVVAASTKFYAYDHSSENNLQLGASGQIQSLANSSVNLRYNTGTPGGGRWYNGTTGSSVYLYKITSKFTITYNAGTGSCKTSDTEISAGSGIILPSATPSVSCAAEGWVFAGWKQTSALSVTTTIPTLIPGGSVYHPHSSETLYAVYRVGDVYTIDFESTEGTYSDWTFTRITSQSSDSYIISHGAKIGLTTSTNPNSVETKNKITSPKAIRFYVSKTTTSTSNSTWNVYTSSDGSEWTSRKEQDAKSMLRGQWVEVTQDLSSYTNVYVKIEYAGNTAIKAIDDVVLSCATYNSNPSCCDKLVALSAGTETNATISSFSPSSVPTCSATDADRNVTITVAAATGYEFTSSARLSYSGDGTATYQSGPTDNGDGTYSFVYQFAQNDNGSGTFSVTSATPKNYTISFDANGGTGSMDGVVKAYGSTYDLPVSTFTRPTGKMFDNSWAEGSAGGTGHAVGYTHTVSGDITFYAIWRDGVYSDSKFSCAELTLTAHPETAGAPIFITSMADKKVRSQGYITITGNGLTPSTALTFPDLNSKFEVLTSTGGTISTDASGAIDVNAYIFYTPGAGDTSDGLDQMAGLTVSVGGGKPKQVSLVQSIIGRHLPTAGYVIAGKKDNKWYALPSDMASTSTPAPSEIAVDDINDPSIAYTAASNIYGLAGPTASNISGGNGQYIRLMMSIDDGNDPAGPAPLSGTGDAQIGKSGKSKATSDLSAGWWWALTQTNTSITNPQDAKYTIKCANNTNNLRIKNSPFVWGQYASGVQELRLIPASNIPFTEAYFVEWGQYGGVIEVDATGISATKVQAKLNGNESLVKTLSQTLTSGKSRASIYNYTLNFNDLGNVIDFSAAASNGALLTLDWYNSSDVLVAKTSMVVPKIIASSSDMKTLMSGDAQWETEVHVLPGVTLTANGGSFESSDVRINLLEIYPGAIVKVTTGTLNVASLVLRNGWTRAGTKKFDVARLHIASTANLTKANNTDGWYSDWYVDYDQYYSISVPWEVTLANVKYRYCSVEPTVGGDDGNIRLRYYDGEQRASTAQSQIGKNWKDYGKTGNTAVPSKLLPSMGYAMNAKRPTGKAFSIIRMPMDFPGNEWTALGEKGEVSSVHKDQVNVTGWGYGTSTPWYAMGWNFIGNPYMYDFSGDDDGIKGKMEIQNGGSIRYATIPDEGFKNFDQVNIASTPLRPATGFFIQANSASEQTITFNAGKIVPPAAPERYMTKSEAIPEQEAYIRLSYEGGRDIMGLIIGEDYTEVYEPNADLAKVLGDEGYVKTYMRYGDLDMAYVAINSMLAKERIPVTVKIPTDGEYTFSLTNSSTVDALEGVYLIDYANGDKVTNLIEEDYIFVAETGTISGRFSINAIFGEHKTPTGIDAIQAGADMNSDKPFKFVYHDKVYILHQGVIYDSTGKKVREINK